MIQEILGTRYYGNTIAQWLVALALMLGSVVAGRAVYWLFGNVLGRMAEKTSTRLDEIFIDMHDIRA